MMTTIFDVISYIFEWLRTTEYAPLTIGDFTVTFTLLEILFLPVIAALTVFVVRHIIDLAN